MRPDVLRKCNIKCQLEPVHSLIRPAPRFELKRLHSCVGPRLAAGAPARGASSTCRPNAVRSSTAPAVALDLEYAHYITAVENKHVSVPAWVAVVDHNCALLLKTFIQHEVSAADHWLGGVPPKHSNAAPALDVVLQHLEAVTTGCMLLGHGLSKDLAALGIEHPQELLFDTMAYPGFCNQAGNALNLKQLAKQFLELDIQRQRPTLQQRQQRRKPPRTADGSAEHVRLQDERPPLYLGVSQEHDQQQQQSSNTATCHLRQHVVAGPQADGLCTPMHVELTALQQEQQLEWLRQQQAVGKINRSGHDPEDDAAAVMRLYQQVIFPSTYEGQVAAATAQYLAAMQPPAAEED